MLSFNQAVYIPTGDPEAGSFATLGQAGQIGQKLEWNNGTTASPLWATYRLVKAKASITFAKGEVLYWDDRDDYVVTNVANGGVIAGIVPAGSTAVIPVATEYFYMVIRGRVPVKFIDSPTVAADTAGKLAIATTVAGRADCVTATANVSNLILGRTAGTQSTVTKLATTDVNIFDHA